MISSNLIKRGLFIVFEGPEGAGKTVQAARLAEYLGKIGYGDGKAIHEPGGTRIGETIRGILLDINNKGMQPLAEFFLFLAARVKFVCDIVKPKMENGEIVVADRFALSTMAYQIYARGLPEEQCLTAIDLAVQGCEPDVYFLLLVDPEIGRNRQGLQGKKPDRFESENLDFHRKVTEGYVHFSQRLQNCVVIDTDHLTVEEIQKEVVDYLRKRFGDRFPNL